MLDPVSKQDVKRYISILDVALINLRKSNLFTTVIPSKIFENAGMEIPILMGVDGEARQIVESYKAGLCFEPESKKDFERQLDSSPILSYMNNVKPDAENLHTILTEKYSPDKC